MKGWLTKLSVLTARPWNLSPLWTDNGLMEQDQMGCNQIGLNFELHSLQCRSQFQNKSKKVHYLLCMVELQSVTHMCGLGHNLCHHVCHRWGVWIRLITKLPNSEQSYKGKVKTHKYINRQNQSTTGKLWKRNDPDLVQAFLKKWWVESDFKAPNLPLSLRLKVSGCHYNSIYNNAWTKQVKQLSKAATNSVK
jgi:hypothetical protein